MEWRSIARSVVGRATREEEAEVARWRRERPGHEAYYRRAERWFKERYAAGEEGEVDGREMEREMEEEMERAWRRFVAWTVEEERRRGRRVARRWAAAAAVVAGLAVVTVAVVWQGGKEEGKPAVTTVAERLAPGETRAVLVAASGRNFALEDTTDLERVLAREERLVEQEGGVMREVKEGEREDAGEMEAPRRWNTVVVPRGGEYSLELEDGTRVVLNADSRLRFPVGFGRGERVVELEGEGFFDVARDSARPFVARTGEGGVRVTGTRFNLKAYAGEETVEATLVEGRVTFGGGDGEVVALRPGEQGCLERASGRVTVREVDTTACVAWTRGAWVIEGQRLEDITRQLERWYNVTVFWQNPAAKELVFTGDLRRYEDCEVALRMIELTTRVHFAVKGRAITVQYNP